MLVDALDAANARNAGKGRRDLRGRPCEVAGIKVDIGARPYAVDCQEEVGLRMLKERMLPAIKRQVGVDVKRGDPLRAVLVEIIVELHKSLDLRLVAGLVGDSSSLTSGTQPSPPSVPCTGAEAFDSIFDTLRTTMPCIVLDVNDAEVVEIALIGYIMVKAMALIRRRLLIWHQEANEPTTA